MYAYESPQFNSGMLAHYLTTQLAQIGKASGLVLLLISRVNWKADASDFGPRGAISHLTVKKMAVALGCSSSTVQEHLAILRSKGIIASERVTNRHGATQYCRFWFSGFVSWLQGREAKPSEADAGTSAPPSSPSVGGGSEKSETYHNNKNQNIIDLDEIKSVHFSPLEAVIREARPTLSNGTRADSQLVFERFRSFNLRKGTSRISLAALRGFAKNFTEFRAKSVDPRPSKPEALPVIPAAYKPSAGDTERMEHPNSPMDLALKNELKAREPVLFNAWFANLTFSRDGEVLRVAAPTIFIRNYVSNHFEGLIQGVVGPDVKVAFA